MHFCLRPLRFSFLVHEPIYFPQGKSANVLRGAFGTTFRKIACMPRCFAVRDCELRSTCPYARMFEPSATAQHSRGIADWPRPFVFRATHLDGIKFPPGARFHFDLNLFDTNASAVAYLVLTFAQLAREGLGACRGKVELLRVDQLDRYKCPAALIYENASANIRQDVPALNLSLKSDAGFVTDLRVRFITPTELKSAEQIASTPDFGILASRIRDRISTLGELYGNGPLAIDFRAFAERASRIRMTRCQLSEIDVKRRSSRTHQVHSIGGFIGEADYEGDLTEFVPYLRAAQWTGVGRQTVWGKGQIEVTSL